MSHSRKSTRPRMFHPHARLIIFNVLRFMSQEAQSASNIISIHKVEERVAMATGISRRTLSRIKKEFKDAEETSSKISRPRGKSNRANRNSKKKQTKSQNVSAHLPQIVMQPEKEINIDYGDDVPQIVFKSEADFEAAGESIKMETDGSGYEMIYNNQNVILPELIIKSESESYDSDTD